MPLTRVPGSMIEDASIEQEKLSARIWRDLPVEVANNDGAGVTYNLGNKLDFHGIACEYLVTRGTEHQGGFFRIVGDETDIELLNGSFDFIGFPASVAADIGITFSAEYDGDDILLRLQSDNRGGVTTGRLSYLQMPPA